MTQKLILTAAMISLAIVTTTKSQATEAQQEKAAENFAQADANADGALTFDEFALLIDLNADDGVGRTEMIKRMGKQSVAFGRLDANADGLVTTDELSAMAARVQR